MVTQRPVFDEAQKNAAVSFMVRNLIQLGQQLECAIHHANQAAGFSNADFWTAVTEQSASGDALYHRPILRQEGVVPENPYELLDTQAYLKYLLFAETVTSSSRGIRMAFFSAHAMEQGSLRYAQYRSHLRDAVRFRNQYAHASRASLEKLTSGDIHRDLNVICGLLKPLAGSAWDRTNSLSVEYHCKKMLTECNTQFQDSPIQLEELEERVLWRIRAQSPQGAEAFRRALEGCDCRVEGAFVHSEIPIEQLVDKLCSAPSLVALAPRQEASTPDATPAPAPSIPWASAISPAQLKQHVTAKPMLPLDAQEISFLMGAFTCLLEDSVLLEESGRKLLTNIIAPAMPRGSNCLSVDESVVSAIFTTFRSTAAYTPFELASLDTQEVDELVAQRERQHKNTKRAIKVLGHLRSLGHLQVVSSLLPGEDSHQNIRHLVEQYTQKPILIFTFQQQLVAQLAELQMEHVLACKPTLDDELLLYRGTLRNFMPSQETADAPQPSPHQESYCAIGMGSKVLRESPMGSAVELLLKKAIGDGGEGTIYETSDPDLVAKVYFPKNCTQARLEKLTYMIANNPNVGGLAWPVALLRDEKGRWVGFLMERVVGAQLALTVFHPGRKCQNIDRFGWDRRSLAMICQNIADIFHQLHQKNILMGDINPRNILVASDCSVGLVDCDSYQMGPYDCPVGTPLYTPPEVHRHMRQTGRVNYGYHRTIEHERYSLAVLLFEVLMLGKAPYESSKNDMNDVVDAIVAGHFPYRYDGGDTDTTQFNMKTPVGKWRNIWSHLPWREKTDFYHVFTGKERIPAEKWRDNMAEYARLISNGHSSNQLMPTGYKVVSGNGAGEGTEMVDLHCVDCNVDFNLARDVHRWRKDQNEDTLCEQCRDMRRNLRNRKSPVVCAQCGVQFLKQTQQCIELHQRGNRIYCDRCRQQYSFLR